MAQILVPVADQATGSWTATPLWSKVDDDSTQNPTGDGTTITSDDNTSPDQADFELPNSGVQTPAAGDHILRARWNKDSTGGHQIDPELELWQGIPGTGSLVATLAVTDVGATETESTYTLNGTEVGNITDYNDLYLRLERVGDTGGNPNGRRSLIVDLVEFEIPDAGVTTRSGTASAAVSVSGSAAGVPTRLATAAGSVSITGTATGEVPSPTKTGTASGTVTVTGTAAGVRTRLGTAAGAITVTGTAAGEVPGGSKTGTATGTVTVSGVSAGEQNLGPVIVGGLAFEVIQWWRHPGGHLIQTNRWTRVAAKPSEGFEIVSARYLVLVHHIKDGTLDRVCRQAWLDTAGDPAATVKAALDAAMGGASFAKLGSA